MSEPFTEPIVEPFTEPIVDGVPGPNPARVSSSVIEVSWDACPVAGPCPARGGDDPYEKNMGFAALFQQNRTGSTSRIR